MTLPANIDGQVGLRCGHFVANTRANKVGHVRTVRDEERSLGPFLAWSSQLPSSQEPQSGPPPVPGRILIVDDDPEKLQQLLKQYRRGLLQGYRFDLTSHAVAGSFSCNRMALLPFADKIGANNVSTYLRGGVVTIEELVSSTN